MRCILISISSSISPFFRCFQCLMHFFFVQTKIFNFSMEFSFFLVKIHFRNVLNDHTCVCASFLLTIESFIVVFLYTKNSILKPTKTSILNDNEAFMEKKNAFSSFLLLIFEKMCFDGCYCSKYTCMERFVGFLAQFFFTNKFVCFAKMCFLALYLNETYTHRSVKAKKTDIARSGKQYLTAQKTHSFIW